MKKEIRKIITIIKTAPHLKFQIIFSVIMLLAGIICEFLIYNNFAFMVLLTNSVLFFHQSIMTASGSGLAQSSASAKKFQTAFPFYIQIPMYIITFLIISLHRLYIASSPLQDVSSKNNFYPQDGIFYYSALCFCFLIYEAICYKHIILSSIFLFITLFPIILFTFILDIFLKISLTSTIALGFLIIIAGSLLAILAANLLYKYPISAHMMKENTKS